MMVEITKIIQNRIQLEKALSEDIPWLASEMYAMGFLSQEKRDDVTNARSVLTDANKAGVIVSALERKVDVNPRNFQKFVETLRKHPRQVYSDAVELLDTAGFAPGHYDGPQLQGNFQLPPQSYGHYPPYGYGQLQQPHHYYHKQHLNYREHSPGYLRTHSPEASIFGRHSPELHLRGQYSSKVSLRSEDEVHRQFVHQSTPTVEIEYSSPSGKLNGSKEEIQEQKVLYYQISHQADISKVIMEKDLEIQQQHREMLEKDTQIQLLQTSLLDKNKEIKSMESMIEESQKNMELKERKWKDKLQSYETEVNILREELRRCLEQEEPLPLPLQLEWRRGPDMPFEMGDYVQSVFLADGTVYVGGGFAGRKSKKNYIVMKYNTRSGRWSELPPYRACGFAMTVINKQLVLVGGHEASKANKLLGVWKSSTEKWKYPYPEMPTRRSICSAVTYKEWLIVAGGWSDSEKALSSVEMLNTEMKQWHVGGPTPVPWTVMRSAVVGDVCYFMGGRSRSADGTTSRSDLIYSVSLPALVSQQHIHKSRNTEGDHDIWKTIEASNIVYSTPLSIRGSLLILGGQKQKSYQSLTHIHLYRPDTEEWVKVGELPSPRFRCSSVVINGNKEIFLAGGCVDSSNSVHIAALS